MDAVVLLSGGLDSLACAEFYRSRGFKVKGLFFKYGQAAEARERETVKKLSLMLRIPLVVSSINLERRFESGEILGRNALLIFAAIARFSNLRGIVALGLHSGVPYYDAKQPFLKAINRIIDGYCNGNIRVECPFITWTKAAVFRFSVDRSLPVHLTYSCEAGNRKCGRCASCKDRRRLGISKIHSFDFPVRRTA